METRVRLILTAFLTVCAAGWVPETAHGQDPFAGLASPLVANRSLVRDTTPAGYAPRMMAPPALSGDRPVVPINFESESGSIVGRDNVTGAPWMSSTSGVTDGGYLDVNVQSGGAALLDAPLSGEFSSLPPDLWYWQLLPDGLIFRSYQAGPREPKISTVLIKEDGRALWDPIVGGRMGLIRFGTDDVLFPQGWQLDVEGAAIIRMDLDNERDVDGSDFRFGFPITYGVGQWQFKFGYYHLSSHLGDEFLARHPGATRINYVRDSLFVGASYFPVPALRLYGETAWTISRSGGAEPWEFQFGAEWSQPGPTGPYGTPFAAVNAHLREELNFGGDLTFQTGWLWRGPSGHMMRVGLHYMNGKSTQYQFFRQHEEQVGVGLWYDF